MDVGRKNFNEILPKVRESIDKADFLAIDAEFSGLKIGRSGSVFDTPEEYYCNILNGCTDFTLMQYGLSTFHWDVDKKQYMNETYNFYLFPRGKLGPEKIFSCQSSSLQFLCSQGFDFNKWIHDGISYMIEPIETKLRETLSEKHKNFTKPRESNMVPEACHRPMLERSCAKVKDFLEKGELDSIDIDQCNSFERLLLFQELRKKFKDKVILETKTLYDNTRVLKVTRVKSQEHSDNHERETKESEWQDLEDAVGFSKVARMISQSEKLVIGHNMLLDVIHTLNHFFQPLPNDYGLFKEFTHCMFPSLLDTKYMSSLPPFKDKTPSSALPHLLESLSEPPFSLPNVAPVAPGGGYKGDEKRNHEAGYDAYTTGRCFLAMFQHLARMRGEVPRCDITSPILKPFLNKLYLARTALQDSPYMNLAGSDPTPCRDHVFYLTFPKDWSRNDINNLFTPFGSVIVQFEDDKHAFVGLQRRDLSRSVLRSLRGNHNISLITYDEYQRIQSRYEYIPDYGQPTQRHISITYQPEEEYQNSPISEEFPPKFVTSPLRQQKSPRPRAQSVSVSKPSGPISRKRNSSSVTQVENKQKAESPPVIQSKSDKAIKKDDNEKSKDCNTETSPTQGNRKRTSSGVFQVDDSEPPSKKPENTEVKKKTNDRRKEKEVPNTEGATKKKNIIERFDNEAKTVCVNAFKESDSWD